VKLLVVTPAYIPAWKYGGVASAVHSMAQELTAQGEDVTVYTTDAGLNGNYDGKQKGFQILNGVKVHYFKCDCEKPILSRALTEAIEENIHQFDLVHLAAVWQPISIGVRRAAVKAGCPYVLAPHGSLNAWPIRYKSLKKYFYFQFVERKTVRLASGIVYCSQMEMEGSSRFAYEGQTLCNISNGLNFANWVRNADQAKRWRAEAGISEDRFLLLYVGRLHHIKGLDLAISALTPLHGRNWHLSLIGNDEDGTGTRLVKQVSELGLNDQVSFHPTVSPQVLPAIYSAGDLLILPSYHENFGNVVLEALACGCPALVSDQVGVACELDGIRGVGVRKRDLNLWAGALRDALNGGVEFKVNAADREELERRFSIENAARIMREFYHTVISRARA